MLYFLLVKVQEVSIVFHVHAAPFGPSILEYLINLPHLDPQSSLNLYTHTLLSAVFGKEEIGPKPNMISSVKIMVLISDESQLEFAVEYL